METIEGRQSVFAALQARQRRFQMILVAHGAHVEKFTEVMELAEQLGVPVRTADRKELDQMAHGASHGGMLALAGPKPRLDGDSLVEVVERLGRRPAMLLLIEGVEDARNLGFTLRSAEALGAHAVLIKKHVWDLDATEIARPSSGAYERLPLVQIDSIDPLVKVQRLGCKLYGCIAGAKRTVFDVDMTGPSVLAIGGEKRGLSGAVREICDRFVTIPTAAGGASLSMSHAACMVMGEAMRQRLMKSREQAALVPDGITDPL
ncbi:MAG TPA: RNA methyltransferase [Tepidisphaeraceae bacterium]|nr:RNA methyltransferase [Tepidisphaeraceae bacterium]